MINQALLTDSEWRVMRVLWEKPATTAAAVTAALSDDTAWSPTTVKTFLSRLCHKGLVRYASDRGKYLYSPAVSERDCVVAEMKAVLNRVYGGTVRGETDHFVFYGVDDAALAFRLGGYLESFYARMARDFGYRREEKQIVYLYPSIHRMHSALGLQAGPDWLRASRDWDILHLAPEKLFDDMTIERAASHVWVQIAVRDLSPRVPYWFEQGFAAYESGWIGKDRFERAMQRQGRLVTPKTIPNLSFRYDGFRADDGYELSWTIIDFLHRAFGRPAIAAFLKDPRRFDAAFGMDEPAFWARWAEDFQKQYAVREGSDQR